MKQVIDSDGVWVQSRASFTFEDPDTKVKFDPAHEYKVKLSNWVKNQITAKVFMLTPDADKEADPTAEELAALAEQKDRDEKAAAAAAAKGNPGSKKN